MKPEEVNPEQLLAAAKHGRSDELGSLLELYRGYLYLLARTQIGMHLKGRIDASDVVQETFLNACLHFEEFRGNSEKELMAWLRRILINSLARSVEKQILAQKRDARREISLENGLAKLEESAANFDAALAGNCSTPSAQAQRRELAAVFADQLLRLPETYREVIVLRNLEGLPFEEVALRMDRSAGAARILWLRALEQLRQMTALEELL